LTPQAQARPLFYDVHFNANTWRTDFVSQEAQDAVIGRVVREQAETRKNIETVGAEAHRLGKILEQIGRMLQTYPQTLITQGESFNKESLDGQQVHIIPSDFPDAGKVASVAGDMRRFIEQSHELERQRRALGV
jgi:hypothetical protein